MWNAQKSPNSMRPPPPKNASQRCLSGFSVHLVDDTQRALRDVGLWNGTALRFSDQQDDGDEPAQHQRERETYAPMDYGMEPLCGTPTSRRW